MPGRFMPSGILTEHPHTCILDDGGTAGRKCYACEDEKMARNRHDDDEVVERDEATGLGEQKPKIRKFETGATRDTNDGKLNYEGFNSALVEKRFAEYMHVHRIQPDGSLRAADNWQKGIPKEAYMESLKRHVMDLWLHYDGFPEEAVDKDIESVLCAIRFNVNGMLFEILKEKKAPKTKKCTCGDNCEHLQKLRAANDLDI